jgi:protein-disulfide isomerase
MKNYVIVALGTALLVIGLIWVWSPSDGQTPSAAAVGSGVAGLATGVSEEGSYIKGEEDAPVTLFEFSDYQCPFCGRYFTQTYPQIEENYVKTGKVKIVFKDFPLDSIHPEATPAALAARCAGDQGKYWEMHDILFTNQATLSNSAYKQWAVQLDLDAEEFNTCLDTRKHLSAVRSNLAEGQQAGIQGTPGFIINGQLISGAQPFPVFQQAIESALAQG